MISNHRIRLIAFAAGCGVILAELALVSHLHAEPRAAVSGDSGEVWQQTDDVANRTERTDLECRVASARTSAGGVVLL